MPGAMRRMGVYLGLLEDDEYADDDYAPAAPPAPARTAAPRRDERAQAVVHADVYDRFEDEVALPEPISAAYQITAVHPRTYNEARTIGEAFRNHTPVIMNLTDMDDADAKRLVDFAAGLTFGLRGTIERVTAKVFLLSPANITVTAAERAKMAETGSFFNQS